MSQSQTTHAATQNSVKPAVFELDSDMLKATPATVQGYSKPQ